MIQIRNLRSMLQAILVLSALAPLLQGQQTVTPAEVENEQILGINKEPHHATLMPYKDRNEALAANREASTWARSLNGQWKFHWVPRPEERSIDFYKPDFDVSAWKESDGKVLQVSALPLMDEQFEAPAHSEDLPPEQLNSTHVGCEDAGGVIEQLRTKAFASMVWSDPTEFSYVLRIVPAGDHNLSDAARVPVYGGSSTVIESDN